MSWNYRVVKHVVHEEEPPTEWFAIHEVYYDEHGNIKAITISPTFPIGDTEEELRKAFELYEQAFKRKVVNYDEVNFKKK